MTQEFLSLRRAPPVGGHVWPLHCRSVLTAAIDETCQHLPASGPSSDDVHAARRGLKKSAALALLLRQTTGETSDACDMAVDVFKRVRKSLGDTRDLDVMADVFASLRSDLDPAFAAKLESVLHREKKQHIALGALNPRHLCDDLERQAALIEQWSLVHANTSSVVDGARRTYKKAIERGFPAFESENPEELHALRKSVVNFRYQMDALAPAWPKLFDATVTEAQHLRTFLGDHHDLAMLATFAACRDELHDDYDSFHAKITARQANLIKKAQMSFVRLFGERPRGFAQRLRACLEHPKRAVKWRTTARPSRRRA
jgi:CHAD domain-containing protein